MYQPSFESCWAKINRAEELRNALDKEIWEFLQDERNRATMRADADAQTGYHILSLQTVPDLSAFQQRTSVIVGEIVHDLRSTLDHLTWQLACHNTNENPLYPRTVQFPIEDRPADFTKRCEEKGWIGEVAPAHQAVIKRYQPVPGLNPPSQQFWARYVHELALLRDLSNADKHRVLIEIDLPVTGFHLLVRFAPGAIGPFEHDREFPIDHTLKVGAQVMRARLISGPNISKIEPHMEMVGHATPEVCLIKGGPVVPNLGRISTFVSYIIREFEQLPY